MSSIFTGTDMFGGVSQYYNNLAKLEKERDDKELLEFETAKIPLNEGEYYYHDLELKKKIISIK